MKVRGMIVTYRKALSFVRRSYMLQMSYKFEFFLRLFFMFFNILTYYFVAKLIGTAGAKYLEPYGGDYFSFVLIGIAFSGYLMVSLRGFSESVRDEQMMGTLEAMLVTPTDASSIITLSTLSNFIFASFRVLLYLMIGVLLGVSLAGANTLAALIILSLTIVCFSSIGILSASFIMIFKRGDPINMLFMSTSELFGGGLLPHHRPPQLASDRLSSLADDLLPERDEARSPPGLHSARPGAGRGDSRTILGVALTGEPPRLSVCGPEGEDGGDAGALLRKRVNTNLEFGRPRRPEAYFLFFTQPANLPKAALRFTPFSSVISCSYWKNMRGSMNFNLSAALSLVSSTTFNDCSTSSELIGLRSS
ncbi:ABC transporter permease [Methanocrinis sp.]|uniref:ABC transporter permease n=1 Tax=Methanocrinis sp. TaxID=3101522 RepID=UPI003D1526C0